MKILVFEYITGGGFNKQELPDSLVDEGRLMLNALLDNLVRLDGLEVTVMMDWRLDQSIARTGIDTVVIRPEHDISEEFARRVTQSDLVWPIAPEFDGILETLCQTVESSGKMLLTSPATAVAIAGNKFKTYELLNQHQITAVPTRMFEGSEYTRGEWIVKPVDGVSCADSYVISNRQEFEQMTARKGEYIIQPHLQGAKTSLSCLFKQGRGWLVCANLQHFDFINQQYQLADIVVNHHQDLGFYQPVIAKIAQALPELWGYVGIDLIETATQTWVLEINPRLTTSFVGIYEALGINIAEAVLQLLHGEPMLNPVCNSPITVQAKQTSVGAAGRSPLQYVGWDIGGAHVKAAVIKDGEIIAVYQQPCPLWRGLDQLHQAVTAIMQELVGSNRHAITMTGELVDLFDNRDDGVKQIIQTMTELLPGSELLVFAGQQGFLQCSEIDARHYSSIASANWLASALCAARKIGSGLFVDCGSTTTDILLLNDGQVLAEGYTDYQRLISQELIYTGIVRTAVMAVTQTALDQGEKIGLMAEYFATMADVYRVTGELNEAHDQTDTADGAEKTVLASARRLSRMIGCDFYPDELPRWQKFAENIRAQQIQQIQRGCEARLSQHALAQNSPLIGAGVGRFLVRQIALNLGRPYLDFSDLLPAAAIGADLTAADCAPAASIAYLAGGVGSVC